MKEISAHEANAGFPVPEGMRVLLLNRLEYVCKSVPCDKCDGTGNTHANKCRCCKGGCAFCKGTGSVPARVAVPVEEKR